MAHKALGETEKAVRFYRKAISHAAECYYKQLEGKAFLLAEIYRQERSFEMALSHHKESVEILDKIGAKCDLAEALYQLGLTYQAMGETEKSGENFQKSIQLFTEMEAPKQVERVRKSMQNSN